MAGRLTVCPTPIGNMEDISARALAGARARPTSSPARTRAAPAACSSGSRSTRPRLVSNHEQNEAERARQLAQQIERGAKVVLISDAGTPVISDPGYRLIRACIERGLEVEVLPGPVGGHDRARRLRPARRPLALRGLPAAPRGRARARARLDRDRRRVRVAAAPAGVARRRSRRSRPTAPPPSAAS